MNGYIPFHFHPYSAFDIAVKKAHPDEEMIYICITRALAKANHFKILPKHPLALDEHHLYNYDEGFNRIDWDTMMQVGLSNEEAKHVKMAECLSHLVIPVEYFNCFFVSSKDVKEKVEFLLKEKGVGFPPPFINVMPRWFE